MHARLTKLLISGAAGALVLALPTAAVARTDASITSTSTSTAATTTAETTSSSTTTTTTASAPSSQPAEGPSEQASSTTSTQMSVPEVRTQAAQPQSSGVRRRSHEHHGVAPRSAKGRNGKSSAPSPPPSVAGRNGLAPLPFSLRTPISGLPSLFLEAFDVPPFLLPIYQAAGIAYGVPWQVLAAINEVESDYGRDLNLSSAGAEGWMQFLPAEWRQWGVDAGGSGYIDPYNPADAIFAAARYLAAAGGAAHIRTAIFAYNHSQSYVESVMLRAQLLGGLPPEMLGAVTDLAEARFPVHAAAHFSDAFSVVPAGRAAGKTIVATTIYSEPGAPAIAVKDGTIVALGDSPALGLHLSLRDAYGDVFTYADLGEVASVYPVLAPRDRLRHARTPASRKAAPRGPASAGVQPHSPLSEAAVASGFTFGVTEGIQRAPARPQAATRIVGKPRAAARPRVRSFIEGPERVYLRTLRPGAQVIAGTVLGRLASGSAPHMLFQVRPGGALSPLIDPKPLLDSWVALEDSGVFSAKGQDPFLSIAPTAGQALLESRGQLQQQVLRDRSIRLPRCARAEVEAGRVDRRVLATLELLAVSGLRLSVTHLRCGGAHDSPNGLHGYQSGDAVDIGAVDGIPIAGHSGPGGVADLLERKLLTLQGTMKPTQIAGPVAYLASREASSLPASSDVVHIDFSSPRGARAELASAGPALIGSDWTALDERLAEISDPKVSQSRSAAALPDAEGVSGLEGAAGREGVVGREGAAGYEGTVSREGGR